jgi:hypothetical protein
MIYLTSPCNLYQDIFFLGDAPNYNPTIHPPWQVSFVVKVVNLGFNTVAPYVASDVGARTCVYDISSSSSS